MEYYQLVGLITCVLITPTHIYGEAIHRLPIANATIGSARPSLGKDVGNLQMPTNRPVSEGPLRRQQGDIDGVV
jgi:hypothetical protein